MPPVGKAEEALRKQKEARQKKVLLVLVPVFLVLVFWQGPGMLKAFSGGSAPAEETAPAAPAATTTDPAAAAPPSTAGGGGAAPPPGPATLPETGGAATAGPGQLVTFDRFVGKDPFRQQVEAEGESAESGGSGSSTGSTDSTDDGDSVDGSASDVQDGGSEGGDATTPGASDGGGTDGGSSGGAAPTSATIEVNGTREDVSVNAPFPTIDPIFRLVSLTRRSAKIGLVSGEFSNGSQTVTLARGRPLTLVSEPDGLRYVITLVKVA